MNVKAHRITFDQFKGRITDKMKQELEGIMYEILIKYKPWKIGFSSDKEDHYKDENTPRKAWIWEELQELMKSEGYYFNSKVKGGWGYGSFVNDDIELETFKNFGIYGKIETYEVSD